jgi:hypothetical protein
MEQKQRFLENGIPYDEIDPEMIDIVDILNFKLGYKTRFCCYGHRKYDNFYIMFDTNVSDEMIYKMMKHLNDKKFQYGTFNKWARYVNTSIFLNPATGRYETPEEDTLLVTWMWESALGSKDFDDMKKIAMFNLCGSLNDFTL